MFQYEHSSDQDPCPFPKSCACNFARCTGQIRVLCSNNFGSAYRFSSWTQGRSLYIWMSYALVPRSSEIQAQTSRGRQILSRHLLAFVLSCYNPSMGRPPCCDEKGLKKGPWTLEEDQKLMNYIQKHGHGSWRALPELAGTSTVKHFCVLCTQLSEKTQFCVFFLQA